MNDESLKYVGIEDTDDPRVREVYREIRNFYKVPDKHESPTRRLRQQMDTAWTQKSFLSKQAEYIENKGKYGITYVVGVSNTYCVQPEKGELPYEMVEKSPKKFYQEVMDSKVQEHKIQKSPKKTRIVGGKNSEFPLKKVRKSKTTLQYKTKICKRSVARILSIIQNKMRRLISDVTGDVHSPSKIQRAMSNPAAEKILQRQITDGSVKLVHQDSQEPAFTRQMSKIGEQGFEAAKQQTQTDVDDESFFQQDPEDCELVSQNCPLPKLQFC